ncbi:MAG: DUF308 domain-containing protein [Bacteroidales bacterium]|nr:DUF308 domain-containing protein [Bacteroidales bacterium]
MESNLSNYRSLLVINGIIAILFGIFALFVPQATAKTIVVYFGIILIVGGAAGLYLSIHQMKKNKPYIVNLLSSLLSVLVGIFIAVYTRRSLEIFAIIIGIWAVIVGLFQLIISFNLSKTNVQRKVLMLNSIITLIFGLILFFNPFESVVAILFVVGALAVVFGAVLIYLSMILKKFEGQITKLK